MFFYFNWFLLFVIAFCNSQCPCKNGGTCTSKNKCFCMDGWTGKQCQRPCVDFYKSCKVWDEESRCEWTRGLTTFFLDNCPVTCNQCVFDAKTVPQGLPLPPILEPLKNLVGVWRAETSFPDRYPVKFLSSGGYTEIIVISIAEVPGFDTPSLNYSVTAEKFNDPDDSQSELGFIWMKPGQSRVKLIGNMITTNSGLTVIQEGVLDDDVIRFNVTTYSQTYPSARNPTPEELESERTLDFSAPGRLIQTVKENGGKIYEKIYRKIEIIE